MKKTKNRFNVPSLSGFTTQFLLSCFVLVFLALPANLSAQKSNQPFKLSGVVTDDIQKDPLIGVNIIIVGKTKGTISDINGKFSLEVNSGDVLKFSYVGYQEKTQKVIGSVLNVALEENSQRLGEVVIQAGYGGIQKRDVTGSVVSISEKDLDKRMSGSITEALQGAASGVQVLGASGDPSAEPTIRIRGTSTLSDAGVNPLFIVDGMTVDRIDNINSSDIQSMEILKDASSAAIYGSRSANGVVIITTKKGVVGKPKFDVKYLRSYSQLSHKLNQSNTFERRVFENRKLTLQGVSQPIIDSTALTINNDNDYQSILAVTGIRNQADITLTGGNKELQYYNSFQYYDQTGIVNNSWLKRVLARVNVDYTPNKVISTGTRMAFSNSNSNSINESKVLASAFSRPPHFILTFPDGTPAYNIAGQVNPIAEETLRKNQTMLYSLNALQYLQLNIGKGFSFRDEVSGKLDFKRGESFNSKLLSTAVPASNSGNEYFNMATYLANTAYFTYKYATKNKKIKFETTLGSTIENWKSTYAGIGGINYVSETVTTANSISSLDPAYTHSRKESNSLAGFFWRARYDYKGRYLLSSTVRRDGSSRFGVNNRWGWFPSVSGAWRLSDEKFMKWSKPVLSDAKFRVGWGVTGNERIGNYDSQNQYVLGTYYYNDISGFIPNSRLGNADLKWEETKQSNIGLDLLFLEGKINFVADFYKKDTKDLLYLTTLPQESGFPDAWTNFGTIRNTGLEFTLNVTPIKTKNFKWETSLNYSQNENVITDLAGVNRADDIWWIGSGSAAGSFYGYKYLGIYQYDQSNAWTNDFKTNLTPVFQKDEYGNVVVGKNMNPTLEGYTLPNGTAYTGTVYQKKTNGVISKGGDVIWEEVPDENGVVDGEVSSTDRQILGSGQPKWYGAWSNTVNYKGFSLSFSFYGSFGNKIYNELVRSSAALVSSNGTPPPFYAYNLWKYPGQITPLYNANNIAANNSRQDGSYFLEDGSFIRLQSVRLGYTFDKKFLKKTPLTAATVYVYGNGLASWTNYTGYDPEVAQNSVLKPGKDTGRYPRKKEFGVSLNITL